MSSPLMNLLPSGALLSEFAPQIMSLLGNSLPNNMQGIRQGINQSLPTPDFTRAMEMLPRRNGVAFNSPNRIAMGAMGAADQMHSNAVQRPLSILGAEFENKFGDLQNQSNAMGLRNTLNSMGRDQYLKGLGFELDSQGQNRSQLLNLLSPMFGELAGNY